MLERSGYPDTVVAAAVLHDILEDTEYAADKISKVSP